MRKRHFVATAHSLGNCIHACLNEAIVITKNNTVICAKLVKGKTIDGDYLVLAMRADSISATDHLTLLPDVYDFMLREKADRLPGLVYYVKWACPKCVDHNDGNVTTVAWNPPLSLDKMQYF